MYNDFKAFTYGIVMSVTVCVVSVTEIDVHGLPHSLLSGFL